MLSERFVNQHAYVVLENTKDASSRDCNYGKYELNNSYNQRVRPSLCYHWFVAHKNLTRKEFPRQPKKTNQEPMNE